MTEGTGKEFNKFFLWIRQIRNRNAVLSDWRLLPHLISGIVSLNRTATLTYQFKYMDTCCNPSIPVESFCPLALRTRSARLKSGGTGMPDDTFASHNGLE